MRVRTWLVAQSKATRGHTLHPRPHSRPGGSSDCNLQPPASVGQCPSAVVAVAACVVPPVEPHVPRWPPQAHLTRRGSDCSLCPECVTVARRAVHSRRGGRATRPHAGSSPFDGDGAVTVSTTAGVNSALVLQQRTGGRSRLQSLHAERLSASSTGCSSLLLGSSSLEQLRAAPPPPSSLSALLAQPRCGSAPLSPAACLTPSLLAVSHFCFALPSS